MSFSDSTLITIVSGLPRSGTSMMMQMLAAGGMVVLSDNIRQADEDNVKGYLEFEPVKRTKHDASWLGWAAGKAVKMVYLLLADLPTDYQYGVIFMQRPYAEVAASQDIMLSRRGEKGAGLAADKLAEVFDLQLAKTRDWLAGQPNFEVLYVDYHAVIEDPLKQSQQVCDFIRRQLDVMSMTNAVEPALYRQRAGGG